MMQQDGCIACIWPSHLKGGHILKAVGRSNCLTAQLVWGLTGHAPIGNHRARFHHLPSYCLCGHPFEDAFHVIHACRLWSRADRPRARYLLANFVKFLVENPRAFEFPGANLESAEGKVGPGKGGGDAAAPAPPSPKAHHAGGAALAQTTLPLRLLPGAINVTHRFHRWGATVLKFCRAPNPRVRRGHNPRQPTILFFFK